MPVEIIGIDHVYVAVRDMDTSEEFYDRAMVILGFRKGRGIIGGNPHVFYYGRQFVYALRPAKEATSDHDPYAPGLHHFCFRVVDEEAVDRAASELAEAGVEVTEPRYYPEYGPDYYATFFEDPDRIRSVRSPGLPRFGFVHFDSSPAERRKDASCRCINAAA